MLNIQINRNNDKFSFPDFFAHKFMDLSTKSSSKESIYFSSFRNKFLYKSQVYAIFILFMIKRKKVIHI